MTNVGEANSVYEAAIEWIPGVDVTVTPECLRFSKVNQKMSYEVTFTRSANVPVNASYVQEL